MPLRPVVRALVATLAVGAVFVLAGCAPSSSGAPVPSGSTAPPAASTTPSAPASTPAVPPTVAPSATPTTPPSAAGCKATTVKMPAGAKTRNVGDLDGDKLPDTEWISDTPTLRFGVTTASGATFSYALSSASPAAREGFVTRLNDHRIVSIVDDNRSAYVHFLVNCAWVTPLDVHGVQYTFDMNEFHGHGIGVGCAAGFVVGYQSKNTPTGWTLTQTQLYLSTTGATASNGPTTTIAKNMSSSDPRLVNAAKITCGSVTVQNHGVTVG